MAETTPPTSAIVAVDSAWWSKINWTQMVSMLAMVVAYFGLNLTPEHQAAIVVLIGLLTNGVTVVLKTFFTNSVTAASVASAPVADQSKTVAASTPPGPVADAVPPPA